MKIKKEDNVVVIAGKDKGKTGKVLKVFPKDNKVVVKDINLKTRFIKKGNGRPGEQESFEARIDASNVMIVDPKTKRRSRIGYKVKADGSKSRILKQSNEVIE